MIHIELLSESDSSSQCTLFTTSILVAETTIVIVFTEMQPHKSLSQRNV